MSSYENFKNGLINNPDLSPKPAYGRLDSFVSEDSFKNRHGSGTSQFSATSTDEVSHVMFPLNTDIILSPQFSYDSSL